MKGAAPISSAFVVEQLYRLVAGSDPPASSRQIGIRQPVRGRLGFASQFVASKTEPRLRPGISWTRKAEPRLRLGGSWVHIATNLADASSI